MVELRRYLLDLIGFYRAEPADNLLSGLVHAEADGSTLSEDELVAMILLIVIAGHETTANVLGTTTLRMLHDQSLRHTFATADQARLRAAVEEALRLDGPVQMLERITSVQTNVAGLNLDPGRIVVLLVGAANRDPEVFDQPQDFLVDRDKNPHLAFGAGAHFCIGAPLARLELRIALQTLSRRLPMGTTPAATPVRRPSFTISGLQSLALRWG